MIYVCLALVGLLGVVVIVFGQLLRIERRQSARERDLLVNQLLHAVDRPWQQAPAEIERVQSEVDAAVAAAELRLTTAHPVGDEL